MSSIVLFGKTPKSDNVVPAEVSDLGIQLMKCSPSSLKARVTLHDVQPNHVIFERFLSVYCRVARTGTPVRLDRPYHQFEGELPTFYSTPQIIFSFSAKLDDVESGHLRARYTATETLTKGAPAFVATIPVANMGPLMAEPNLITTTPGTNNAINIHAYRYYVMAMKMIDAILRTNQYPFRDNNEARDDYDTSATHATDERFLLRFPAATQHAEVAAHPPIEEHQIVETRARNLIAHSNLAGPYNGFDYYILGPNQIPQSTGLLFPYVPSLAQPDREIIPSFFSEYMFYGFGSDHVAASEAFDAFKSGMGSIVGTPWGDELAHICTVLDIVLKSQSTCRVLVDAQGRYQGLILLGGAFWLHIRGETILPQSQTTLRADFNAASPHLSALSAIFAILPYATPGDRLTAQLACANLQALRAICMVALLSEENKQDILRHAKRLSFRTDPEFLTMTSHNIQTALLAIADPSVNISSLPIHPSYLLTFNRLEAVWSAFGPSAPSFRVPGGKSMDLSSAFEVVKTVKGVKEKVTIRKIACMIRPLDEAIKDLEAVRDLRTILNPQGNAVINRVSSDSLIKTFEKEPATAVIGALRTFAKISVASAVGAGASREQKRKAEDDGGPTATKRMRTDF